MWVDGVRLSVSFEAKYDPIMGNKDRTTLGRFPPPNTNELDVTLGFKIFCSN